ncbi:ATP-binding protein, partial [Mycobacterium tuberculosis]
MKELHSMIGLEEVKQEVKNIILEIKANRKLEREGISPDKNTMHMIFSGPPGTGKTETARLIAKILQATGYLETGQLIEAQRGDLVAEYQGQTAKKVMDKFEEAKGGVLFIDEAYALKNGE